MFKKESSGLKRVSIKTTYQSKSWPETEGQFKPNDWEEQHLQKCGRIRGAQQGMVENFKGENILCKARGDSTHQPEEGGCAEGPPHSLTRDAAFSGGPRPSWGNLSGNRHSSLAFLLPTNLMPVPPMGQTRMKRRDQGSMLLHFQESRVETGEEWV